MPGAKPQDLDGDPRIAARLKTLRAARGLTLDAVAARSGVSRAMMSRIERGESSPTVGLLRKLCDGLGVTLPALLGDEPSGPAGPLVRRADQPLWRDPGSGYLRRVVSPVGTDSRVEIAEVELPAGAAVLVDALERGGQDRHVWVLGGRVEIGRGGDTLVLESGDCLRAAVDGPWAFRNAGPSPAHYAVITGRADRGGA